MGYGYLQRRLRRVCANVQTIESLRSSHAEGMDVDEGSDHNLHFSSPGFSSSDTHVLSKKLNLFLKCKLYIYLNLLWLSDI